MHIYIYIYICAYMCMYKNTYMYVFMWGPTVKYAVSRSFLVPPTPSDDEPLCGIYCHRVFNLSVGATEKPQGPCATPACGLTIQAVLLRTWAWALRRVSTLFTILKLVPLAFL